VDGSANAREEDLVARDDGGVGKRTLSSSLAESALAIFIRATLCLETQSMVSAERTLRIAVAADARVRFA
jgi:hypothetical protein